MYLRIVLSSCDSKFLLFQQSSSLGDASAGQAVKVDEGDFFFEEIIAKDQDPRFSS